MASREDAIDAMTRRDGPDTNELAQNLSKNYPRPRLMAQSRRWRKAPQHFGRRERTWHVIWNANMSLCRSKMPVHV